MSDDEQPPRRSYSMSIQCAVGDHEQCPDEVRAGCDCFCHRIEAREVDTP